MTAKVRSKISTAPRRRTSFGAIVERELRQAGFEIAADLRRVGARSQIDGDIGDRLVGQVFQQRASDRRMTKPRSLE